MDPFLTMEVLYQLSYPGGSQMLAGSPGAGPGRKLDLLHHEPAGAVSAHADLAAVLKAGLEERSLGDRHPALLVDHCLTAPTELALVVGWLDGSG